MGEEQISAEPAHGADRGIARLLALACFTLVMLLTHDHFGGWSDRSRMAAIESLVHRHSWVIDASPYLSGDQYLFAGHFYSAKPPFDAAAGAAVALGLQLGGLDPTADQPTVLYAVTLATSGLCYTATTVGLFLLLRALDVRRPVALAVTIVAAVATPLLPCATVLDGEVPAALLLLAGAAALRAAEAGSRYATAAAGIVLGAAVGVDSQMVIFWFLGWIFFRRRPAAALLYLAGSLPPLIAVGLVNLHNSGSVWPPDANLSLYRWPGSAIVDGDDFGGIMLRSPGELARYLLQALAGTRGVFRLTPVLLFSIIGLVGAWRTRPARDRTMLIFITAGCTLSLLVTVCGTDDLGGMHFGIRRVANIVPLAMIPLAFWLSRGAHSARGRALFFCALAWSLAVNLIAATDPFVQGYSPAVAALHDLAAAHRGPATARVALLVTAGAIAFGTVFVQLRSAVTLATRRAS